MSINIEHLSADDLMELNKKIVSRIKELKAQEQFKAAARFRMGDVVSFSDKNNVKTTGFITSIRKSTISVLTENNEHWNVSASLLTPEEKPSKKMLALLESILPPALQINVSQR
jgi:hypothetical protein